LSHPSTLIILTALALSVVVHFATYFGINLAAAFPLLWGLHAVAIAAFGAMIFSSRRAQPQGAGFALPKWPSWAFLLAGAAFVYTGINFAAFFALSQGGTPEMRDSSFVLSDHGHVIRTLTADEYRWQEVYIVRGFSGHWMFFLLVPALYFLFRPESPSAPRPPEQPAKLGR